MDRVQVFSVSARPGLYDTSRRWFFSLSHLAISSNRGQINPGNELDGRGGIWVRFTAVNLERVDAVLVDRV